MICNKCGKQFEVENARHCTECGKDYCDECAIELCDCYGELKYYS